LNSCGCTHPHIKHVGLIWFIFDGKVCCDTFVGNAARRAKTAQQNKGPTETRPKEKNEGAKEKSAVREPFMHLQLFAIVWELVTFVLRPPGSRIWPQSISAFCIPATQGEEQKDGGREERVSTTPTTTQNTTRLARCDEE